MATMTGGEIVARQLKAEGVDKIFGIVDGTYLQLVKWCVDLGMELITPRHESIAAHMAGAYARLSGKLGVALASNGPGVANVLPGVAVESAEGNRVLLITSSRRSGIAYPDRGGAYQCFDQVGVIGPMAKWSQSVASHGRIAELTRAALRRSYQGRPGVVHLDLPENLVNGKGEPVPILEPGQYRRTRPQTPSPDEVDRAAELIAGAELPMIQAGSGVIHAGAYQELARLAELLHAPVTNSWSARGVLDERHQLCWPMVHVKAVNSLRSAADLVLCLGCRLGETDWWGKAPNWAPPVRQKLIQVDIDEEVLGRIRPTDLAVLADVKEFLAALLARLAEMGPPEPPAGRLKRVADLAAEHRADREKLDRRLQDIQTPMLSAHVAAICRQVLPDDSVAVFDGGNTAVWGNFYHQIRVPNTQLGTHHFGHLGAGIGQALGAAAARPQAVVHCIIGDGAMGFHPSEIETAVRHGLKVIFLVLCDRQWGMVKINQSATLKPLKTMIKKSLDPAETYSTDLGEIAFDELARSMGAHGERIADPAELKPALQRALDHQGPAVLHLDVDPVKHMWAPGLLHFKAMHAEPKGR